MCQFWLHDTCSWFYKLLASSASGSGRNHILVNLPAEQASWKLQVWCSASPWWLVLPWRQGISRFVGVKMGEGDGQRTWCRGAGSLWRHDLLFLPTVRCLRRGDIDGKAASHSVRPVYYRSSLHVWGQACRALKGFFKRGIYESTDFSRVTWREKHSLLSREKGWSFWSLFQPCILLSCGCPSKHHENLNKEGSTKNCWWISEGLLNWQQKKRDNPNFSPPVWFFIKSDKQLARITNI